MNAILRTLLAILLLNCLSHPGAWAASISWSAAGSGNWSNPDNWTPKQVPGAADTATIPGGGIQVTVDGTFSIGGLTLNAGSALNVPTGRTLNILGAVSLLGPLVNAGTVNWTAGDISICKYAAYGYSGEITNEAGGVFNIGCDRSMSFPYYASQFANAGTLRKSAAAGATDISVFLDNTGTVEVQAGTLRLSGGSGPACGQHPHRRDLAGGE